MMMSTAKQAPARPPAAPGGPDPASIIRLPERGLFYRTTRGPVPPELTRHNEIELLVLECGEYILLCGRRRFRIAPNQLRLFWANVPHGTLGIPDGAICHVLVLPVPWLLEFKLPPAFVDRLLQGESLTGRERREPCTDVALLRSWGKLLRSRDAEARRIVQLQVESRLRELARETRSVWATRATRSLQSVDLSRYERMAQYLATRYREPIRVKDVAAAARLHPVYAIRLFRRMSGMTIHQCLVGHRVAHAERLLTTTDRTVMDIALDSGYNSVRQFNDDFRRQTRQTPRQYRAGIRLAKGA